jgi:predicted transcriptional regulator
MYSDVQKTMTTINIGIAPQEALRSRVLAIARGELRPKASDPKIWFSSMSSLMEILNDDNLELLKLVRKSKPRSISELSTLAQRGRGGVSRRLRILSQRGFIRLEKVGRSIRLVVVD